jgi:hypothetical protein
MKKNYIATIKRLTDVGDSGVKKWQTIGTINGLFMPLSEERRQIAINMGIIGKSYDFYIFSLDEDIQEADRAIINGKTYDVKGIKKYDIDSSLKHLEVLLEEKQD